MSKNVIQQNEEAVKGELKELIRKSVEETPNDELLDKEAEELTGAARYERNEARQGVPQRTLQPQAQHYLRGGSAEYAEAERGNL